MHFKVIVSERVTSSAVVEAESAVHAEELVRSAILAGERETLDLSDVRADELDCVSSPDPVSPASAMLPVVPRQSATISPVEATRRLASLSASLQRLDVTEDEAAREARRTIESVSPVGSDSLVVPLNVAMALRKHPMPVGAA